MCSLDNYVNLVSVIVLILLSFYHLHLSTYMLIACAGSLLFCIIFTTVLWRYCYLCLTDKVREWSQVSESRVKDLTYSVTIISSSLPILIYFCFWIFFSFCVGWELVFCLLHCFKIWKQNRKYHLQVWYFSLLCG